VRLVKPKRRDLAAIVMKVTQRLTARSSTARHPPRAMCRGRHTSRHKVRDDGTFGTRDRG
jgi:hypothetical protein